jgi:hypothetical protein
MDGTWGLAQRNDSDSQLWPCSPLRIGKTGGSHVLFRFLPCIVARDRLADSHAVSCQRSHGNRSCTCCSAIMSLSVFSPFVAFFFLGYKGRQKERQDQQKKEMHKGLAEGPVLCATSTLKQSACEMEHADQHAQFRQFSCERP